MRFKRLFLSYAHADDMWCTAFVDTLKDHGRQVWFDRYELDSGAVGASLERSLLAALERSDLIAMVYSPVSRTSPWVAWELLQRRDTARLIILHDAPIGMVGAFLRSWANYGVYDVGSLSAAMAAELFLPHLDDLRVIADDILQGLLATNRQAEELWQLYGYKSLKGPPFG